MLLLLGPSDVLRQIHVGLRQVKTDKNDLTAHAMLDNSEDSGTEDILSDDFSGWIQMSSLLVV